MTMNLLAQGISLLAVVFSLVMLVLTIVKMRQEAPASKAAPLVAMIGMALATGVQLVVTGAPVNGALAAAMLVIGLVAGLWEGRMSQVYYRGPTLMAKRSVGYLLLWGAAYLLTVALAQTGSAALYAAGMLAMMLGLGAAVGSNLLLLVKELTKRPLSPRSPAPGRYPPTAGAYPAMPPSRPPSLPR
jgi:hypothetical protein